MVSCYEVGREGFWLHRFLQAYRITNHIKGRVMKQRIHAWPILLGIALLIILSMDNLGLHSCLAQEEETVSQVIPNLVVVDALNTAILAADAIYLYGSKGSVLARFGTQDHKESAGYDFGERK